MAKKVLVVAALLLLVGTLGGAIYSAGRLDGAIECLAISRKSSAEVDKLHKQESEALESIIASQQRTIEAQERTIEIMRTLAK